MTLTLADILALGYAEVPLPAEGRESPYFELGLRPLYQRRGSDGLLRYALCVARPQTNRSGAVHGGFIATLCDHLMGGWARTALGIPDSLALVTATLTVDYLKAARQGEWLFLRPDGPPVRVVKANGQLSRGQVLCGGVLGRSEDEADTTARPLYRARAVYAVLDAAGRPTSLPGC